MTAQATLYQAVEGKLQEVVSGERVRITAVRRLALVITGLVAGRSSVVSRMAVGLWEQGVSRVQVASIARRLRRGLHDTRVQAATWYRPAVQQLVDWGSLRQRGKAVVLALDESSQEERLHLLRMSLTYWGKALPLAWRLWPQNTPLAEGAYWDHIDRVLEETAAVVPADLDVVVTADRAYDVPPFIDRLTARGWHWVVRLKANGAGKFRDHQGREHDLARVIRRYVAAPGQRWKTRGALFKKAGWRTVSLVAVWAPGAKEPLVVLTDLPPRWEVLRLYDRRFWIEPGFRTDKSAGWQWEASQLTDQQTVERLLVAMAWATLLVLALGIAHAHLLLAQVAAAPPRGRPRVPQHARESLFTLGLRFARRSLSDPRIPISWLLSHLDAPAWNTAWIHAQIQHALFPQTVRP